MKTLHIAPGYSAGGSLIRATRDAGREDNVLSFGDDLSCGPINSDAARSIWRSEFYNAPEIETAIADFWQRVAATDDRFVVWFGRHSASELSFFLAWADRLGQRPYQIVDVTGQQPVLAGRDGAVKLSQPAPAASVIPADGLRSLLGTERAITDRERDESGRRWRQLQSENALLRVVTDEGLRSAPIDYFDAALLERATPKWQQIRFLVGSAMADNLTPYVQVGDMMLLTRVVALVDAGKLLAEGDPWQMSNRVRLPD